MICPGCGADNPDNAEYCSLCFHRFAPLGVAASVAPGGPAAPAGPMGAGASPGYPGQTVVQPVGPDTVTPFTAAPAYDMPPPPATAGTNDPSAPGYAAAPPKQGTPGFQPPPSDGGPSSYQAQAYGAPPPPMIGVGPGGYQPPPSQWGPQPYDQGSYGAPPPPPTTARKTGLQYSAAGKVLMLAICALFFALGWFATDWYLTKREVAYMSTQSNISFRYPAGWKKVSANEIGSLAGISGLQINYELFLADSTGSSGKYFMGVASVAANPDVWENAKQNVTGAFGANGGSGQTLTPSASISGTTVAQTTVAGSDALDVKMKVNTSGQEAEGRLVYVYNGSRIYMIVFVSRGDSGQGQKILDSVAFKK